MKKHFLLTLLMGLMFSVVAEADKLVILHTNDTHSQIDAADNGLGGVARRKVVIDSVRRSNDNVLLIDAGDAVQGTMYFTIYKGEVEYGVLDALGYDIAVLGNHDFDNGVDELARNLAHSETLWLSANYDFAGAPGLDSVFKPWTIKEYGDKKIGIFGINLVPEGMIAKGNYDGVEYLDAYEKAQSTAHELREAGADYVVAVTHIGYDGAIKPNDCELASSTTGIDLIIGGHSHSMIDPSATEADRFHWKHLNAAGDTVGVVQVGSRGANVGQVVVDLETGDMNYSIITVDSRLDNSLDPELVNMIAGYRNAVDSIMNVEAGNTARKLGKDDAGLMNFLGDFVAWQGEQLAGIPVDMSLINAGGVRRELPEGSISKGMLIDMLPFNNRVVVLAITGADLLEAVECVIKRGGFDGVNEGVEIIFNEDSDIPKEAKINGEPIEAKKVYILSTIDYLANGGDYMTSLPRAREIARSGKVLYDDLIDYVATQWNEKPIDAPAERRIKKLRNETTRE